VALLSVKEFHGLHDDLKIYETSKTLAAMIVALSYGEKIG